MTASEIEITTDNNAPLDALHSGAANVVGGTSWLWTRPEYSDAVDVLFIDEAGQMALADVVAVSRSAKNIVLIGDPQQLDRPLKGSHPPGAESSALQHLLGDHQTIPDSMGLLLPETWRLHPHICTFTSDLFYEGRLSPRGFTRNREISGHSVVERSGLVVRPGRSSGQSQFVGRRGRRDCSHCRESAAPRSEVEPQRRKPSALSPQTTS